MKIVLKIGGSIILDNALNINVPLIRNYVDILKNFTRKGYEFFVVTGGGAIAKKYIRTLRDLGLSEFHNDIIGISFSRIHAFIFSSLLEEYAYPLIPRSWEEVLQIIPALNKRILILGGMQPGQSTNAVAALLAELIKADLLINLTNVDGVYDKNPKEKDAKLLKVITIDKLLTLIEKLSQTAGGYELFDIVAAKVIARSKIPLVFINGNNPENLIKILSGVDVGTKVIFRVS